MTPEEEFEAAPTAEEEFDAAPAELPDLPRDDRPVGQPSFSERALGSLASFASGSPLFGTVSRAADSLTGQRSAQSAQRATDQFSPKVAGVPVLPVLGGVAATLPAGAANIAPRAGAALLGTRGAMAARTGLQGVIGGAMEADKGGSLGDVATGAGVGLAGGALGEGLGAVARRVISRGAGVVGDIVQGRAAKDVADVAGDVAAAEGKYGAAAQALNRTNENLTRQVAGLPSASGSLLPAQTQQKALTTLTDPDTIAALTQIAERDVASLPSKTADYLRLQAAAQAARSAAPGEAAKRTQDYFAQGVVKSEVVPRLVPLAQRAALAAAAGGVSSMLDGGFGVGVGSVMGAQGLLTMGRNVAKSPRVQRAAVEGAMSGIGATGGALRRLGSAGAAVRGQPVKTLNPDDEEAVRAFESAP